MEQGLALKLKHLSVPGGSKPGSRVRMHYRFDERVRAWKIKIPSFASPIPPFRPRYHLLPKDEMRYLEQSLRVETAVTRLETGSQHPRPRTVRKLAKALDITIDELQGRNIGPHLSAADGS